MISYIRNFDDYIAEGDIPSSTEADKHTTDDILSLLISDNFNFGLISTHVFTENDWENKTRMNQLKKDLEKSGYVYLPFKFGYAVPWVENSYMRQEDTAYFVQGISLKELFELGRKYEQDIIVFGNKDEVKSYNVTTGKPLIAMNNQDWKLAMATILYHPDKFISR